MEPSALRSLIHKHGHSAASAADEIGATVTQFRDWTNGRRPVPAGALAKLEHLTGRATGGRRWSPAEIGRSAEAKAPDIAVIKSAPGARSRRKSHRERPLPEFAPGELAPRHPLPAAVQAAGPSATELIEYVARALPAIDGEILPPLPVNLPVVITQPQLPATIPPMHLPAVPQRPIPLPPGVSLPGQWTLYGDVFPGVLFGRACCSPTMTRVSGGELKATFCGTPIREPGDLHCPAHRPAAGSGGFVQMPQSGTLGPKVTRTVPRAVVYD